MVKTESTVEAVKSQGINRFTAIVLVLLHLAAIAALFRFSWKNLIVAAIFYYICTGLGISMGYHRLHTHRSYKVPRWLEYFFALCGTLTLEGGPIFWVAMHRLHHQISDQPGDPHSPRDGAFWSHMGWILCGETNHNNTRVMSKYAPDLAKHRFYVWLNNYHWVPYVILGAIVLAVGGLDMFLWAMCFRVVFGLHATWAGEFGDSHVGSGAGSTLATIRATPGGSPSSASAKAGTTTTTRIRLRPGTAWPGTSSIRPGC